MKKYISLFMLIGGIIIIIAGIVFTIIPLLDFDAFTFPLGKAIIFVFGFSFIGIVMIVLSSIIKSYNKINLMDDIANNVKNELDNNKKDIVCKYCGSKIDTKTHICPNCGAKDMQKK